VEKKFTDNCKIYKPNKTNNGAASQFCWSHEKRCIFIESAPQMPDRDGEGNSLFDWKNNKIIFKLGPPDIAEILCVLDGIKSSVGYADKGLFHSSGNNNAVLKFQKADKSGYYFGISVKKEGSEPVAIKHSITDGEGMILQILLRRAIEIVYDWN